VKKESGKEYRVPVKGSKKRIRLVRGKVKTKKKEERGVLRGVSQVVAKRG